MDQQFEQQVRDIRQAQSDFATYIVGTKGVEYLKRVNAISGIAMLGRALSQDRPDLADASEKLSKNAVLHALAAFDPDVESEETEELVRFAVDLAELSVFRGPADAV